MTVAIREFRARKPDKDGVQGLDRAEPFVAVDPGNDGAAILIIHGSICGLYGPSQEALFAEDCGRLGVRRLIVEGAFVYRNPSGQLDRIDALIRLCRRAGRIVGRVAQALEHADDPGPLEVVWVHPQSWGNFALGLGGHPRRDERKAAALRLAERDLAGHPRYAGATSAVKVGFADAYGIARWWLRLRP